MSVPVNVTTLPVPSSFCPSNIATDWPFLVKLLQASLAGDIIGTIISETTPGVDDQDKPWLKLNADGTPDRIYRYANGYWLSKHPAFAGQLVIWEGAVADIPTLDGGEAGTVTAISGPMWERVTELDGKFPLGVGTLAVSGTVVAEGASGGVDRQDVIVTVAQLPPHQHDLAVEQKGNTVDTEAGFLRVGGSLEVEWSPNNSSRAGWTRSEGDGDPIVLDQMPPYYAVYFLRKTARQYYRV